MYLHFPSHCSPVTLPRVQCTSGISAAFATHSENTIRRRLGRASNYIFRPGAHCFRCTQLDQPDQLAALGDWHAHSSSASDRAGMDRAISHHFDQWCNHTPSYAPPKAVLQNACVHTAALLLATLRTHLMNFAAVFFAANLYMARVPRHVLFLPFCTSTKAPSATLTKQATVLGCTSTVTTF